jgi:hypothetical protein
MKFKKLLKIYSLMTPELFFYISLTVVLFLQGYY